MFPQTTHHILAQLVEVVQNLTGGIVEKRSCHSLIADLACQLFLYSQADVFGTELAHGGG